MTKGDIVIKRVLNIEKSKRKSKNDRERIIKK